MDLQSLRTALEPLTKFGTEEHTFEVEGTVVTLRPLLPREEIAAQQYASEVLTLTQAEEGLGEDDRLTRTAALRYMDQFRIAVIAHALVQINTTDLRNVDTIETGEVLDNGVRVKVPRHVALRDIMADSWSRGMITITFSKYGDLITKIAEKADKVAEASVADLDAEIERLERRLENTKAERKRRTEGDPGITYDQIRGLVSAGEALEREVAQAIDIVQADQEASEAIRAASREVKDLRERVEEEGALDLSEEGPEANEVPPDRGSPRQPVLPPVAPPPSPRVKAPEEFVSSFSDPNEDPNALAADRVRIEAAQRRAAADARTHLQSDSLSRAKQVGVVKGPKGEEIPTYQLPSETISGRGRKPSKEGAPVEPPVDPDPKVGTLNPNFKPTGR